MSIEITIPLDALTNPAVSKALADLVLALGGRSPARRKAAVSTPASAKAKPAKAKPAKRKASRAKKEEPKTWEELEVTLSATTRKFLALVATKGKIGLAEALEELGLPGGKSLGGLTGALARKAGNRGIELPYEQHKDGDGVRMWVAKASAAEVPKRTRRVFRRKPGDKAETTSA